MSDVLEPTVQASSEPNVLLRIINRVAVVRLNRPKALNALSHEMVRLLSAVVHRCRIDDDIVAVVLVGTGGKAFCAGGDVRSLYDLVRKKDSSWRQFFIDEYRLDYAIHRFPKPVVALLDGVVMGGGMGLGQGAWLRVTTERTKMAMPETRIGLLPDVGATHFLSRLPVETQLYLSLTGATLSGSDAVMCQLADFCAASEWLLGFENRLRQIPAYRLNPVFPEELKRTLKAVFEPPQNFPACPPARTLNPLAKRYFGQRSSIEEIVQTLKHDLANCRDGNSQQWIREALGAILQHSPTMLYVTKEAMTRGRQANLADCFRKELGIVTRAVEEGDFLEGVRAHLVEKDHKPRWAPATIWEVRKERVQHFTTSPWRPKDHPLANLEALHP